MQQAQATDSAKLQTFLKTHNERIARDFDAAKCRITLLSAQSESDFAAAAERIRSGQLVAFPTETVYGLGANALDADAVKKIFISKRRPFTDPVIVHVTSVQDALQLTDLRDDARTREIFDALSAKFWPGPLTFILKANFDKIDRVVTAQTDYVGVRWPRNELAQRLINASGRPIAAPSANLFSHVSPTSAAHVFNDFFDQPEVAILEGASEQVVCDFGVESTVVKIVGATNEVLILRYGSLSERAIREAVQGLPGDAITVKKVEKRVALEGTVGQEAPGQLLRHYAPNIATYLLRVVSDEDSQDSGAYARAQFQIGDAIVLDFNAKSRFLSDKCLNYAQMAESDDMREVMKKLYDVLRWAENVPNAKCILVYDVTASGDAGEFTDTVFDKIFRSTEGKRLYVRASDFALFEDGT